MNSREPSAIRSEIRRKRSSLSLQNRQLAAATAARSVVNRPWFLSAQSIAAYLPANGELDPLPVLERAWSQGKRCYLPVLRPFGQQRLWFAQWSPGERLAVNKFGIPEPQQLNDRLIAPWALDIVLMPLVAFDTHGNRVGMGGGYYDRTFAYLHHRSNWRKPLRVGYAYEFQCIKQINARPWDIRLDIAVTDQAVYHLQRNEPGSPSRKK